MRRRGNEFILHAQYFTIWALLFFLERSSEIGALLLKSVEINRTLPARMFDEVSQGFLRFSEVFSFAVEVPRFKCGFLALNTLSQGMHIQLCQAASPMVCIPASTCTCLTSEMCENACGSARSVPLEGPQLTLLLNCPLCSAWVKNQLFSRKVSRLEGGYLCHRPQSQSSRSPLSHGQSLVCSLLC